MLGEAFQETDGLDGLLFPTEEPDPAEMVRFFLQVKQQYGPATQDA